MTTLTCIMAIEGGGRRAADAYVSMQGFEPTASEASAMLRRAGERAVVLGFTMAALEEKAAADPALARALRAARKFHAERQLEDWVAQQNFKKGLTPSSHALLVERRKQMPEEPTASGGGINGSRKSKLQWLRRWRCRHRVYLAQLRCGDLIPVEQKHAKVVMLRNVTRGRSAAN